MGPERRSDSSSHFLRGVWLKRGSSIEFGRSEAALEGGCYSLICFMNPDLICLLREGGETFLVIAQNHLPATNHNGTPNQVRFLRHELQRLIARRWMLLHLSLAVQFVPTIQKIK